MSGLNLIEADKACLRKVKSFDGQAQARYVIVIAQAMQQGKGQMKKIIRKEKTAQARKIQLIYVNSIYEVHLDDAGIFYFDEYYDADTFTGLLSFSNFKPTHSRREPRNRVRTV